jgi:transcription elongation GreA/GreB family factor
MSLYGQRTQRAYEKYKNELNELQEKRKADEATELEEARLLFQLADTQGLAYDPKKDAFVFSLQRIRVHAERHHRLNLAKRTI